MRFRDREQAGELLSRALLPLTGEPAIVYALPRGGVPLGIVVARALGAPLDLVIPRKIGHPMQPEYAIAAVTETGEPVCNAHELGHVDREWFDRRVTEERAEAHRRRALYCHGRPRTSARDRCAILVDDGVATGLTLQAAVREIRGDSPSRVVAAVAVAPADTAARFRDIVDEFIAVEIPEVFEGAVGAYYRDFRQLEDADVVAQLDAFAARRADSPA